MLATILAVLTALLYLVATGIQLTYIRQRQKSIAGTVLAISMAALAGHTILAWQNASLTGAANLGFYQMPVLLFLVINLACMASLTRRPLQNLLLIMFPLSAIAILVATFAPATAPINDNIAGGVFIHIASSILAYSVLTLAAFQAALVAIQDHQLKRHHTRGIVQALPPLQLMESMLFELLWVGVALLTISIGSGIIFLDDMFAQQLAHKTVLSILAWFLFSVLLWGHHRLGWRAQTAVRFTLTGFCLLMLAYFGSKLVLELVLQNS